MATTIAVAMFIIFKMCMRVCVHTCLHMHACVCECVWGLSPPTLTPNQNHTPTPTGGTPHNQ